MEHRVSDPRILRLIRKWLKARVMEEGLVGTADGYTAGFGDLTVARQRVPALQLRSLGPKRPCKFGSLPRGNNNTNYGNLAFTPSTLWDL